MNSCTELHLLPEQTTLHTNHGLSLVQEGLNHCLTKIYPHLSSTQISILINSLEQLYVSIQLLTKMDDNQHHLDQRVRQTLKLTDAYAQGE